MEPVRDRGRAALPSAPDSRLLALCAVAALVAAVAAGPATGSRPAVRSTQALVVLLAPHVARAAPAARSAVVQRVAERRPITGERTVLPVLGVRRGPRGVRWLRVRLPGRPNGHAGWIRAPGTRASSTSWRIVVDISEHRVTIYRAGRAVRAFEAVVGKRSTPTPRGEFFVEEDVQLRRSEVGAPYALALSARSNVLQEFDGGPGQIALHGLRNVGGVLGTSTSHGCVRLDERAMSWLVLRIAPGVPVTVNG